MKEQDIGFWLKQVNAKLRMSADASLKKSGLTMLIPAHEWIRNGSGNEKKK